MRRTRLHKQIRRQLFDSPQEIFVICTPGFETECAAEIRALFPQIREPDVETGGIRLTAELDLIPRLNRSLRTASRILLRMARFTARDFYQLEKAAADIPWSLYFPEGAPPEIRVSCHHCRLYHTEAIAQRIRDAFSGRPPSPMVPPLPESPLPSLFVRGENDRFTLSVDSTGPLLYFRGLKTQGSRAPLRETLAAAILLALSYDPKRSLVDPMCGSGTFSIEAALMAADVAPGSFRRFAWENWPAFLLHKQKEETPQGFLPFPLPSIFASDADPVAASQLKKQCQGHPLLQHIQVQTADFFSLSPPLGPPGLIVLNPPYGLRMQKKTEADALAKNLGPQLSAEWRGWKAGIILPQDTAFSPPKGLRIRAFRHGGLAMHLFSGLLL
jgi:putative N6-adenine-specific DNA methylase